MRRNQSKNSGFGGNETTNPLNLVDSDTEESPSPERSKTRTLSPESRSRSPSVSAKADQDREFVYKLFFLKSDSISIVDFNAVVKGTLGLELRFDDLQRLYARVAGESGITWNGDSVDVGSVIDRVGFDIWWSTPPTAADNETTEDLGFEDVVSELRRLLRVAGVFTASREALAAMSSEKGPEAAKLLFNRIDEGVDNNHDMKLTINDMRILAKDLRVELSEDDVRSCIAEMDPSNRTFVNYKSFEEWWRYGSRTVAGEGSSDNLSNPVRSMLRIGGLLSSQSSTVSAVLTAATSIVKDEPLLNAIDYAMNSITANSAGHAGHLFDSAHGATDNIDGEEDGGKSLLIFATDSPIRVLFAFVTRTLIFEVIVLGCIAANLIVIFFDILVKQRKAREELEILDENQAEDADEFFRVIGIIFNVIFTIEMLMRIIAFTFQGYWNVWWNRFDFIIINTMWIGVIVSLFRDGQDVLSATLTACRSLRAFRFFKGARNIMTTLGIAAETLLLMLGLILMGILMFAVAGRELFGGALSRTCSPVNIYSNTTNTTDTGRRMLGDGGSTDWYITEPTHLCPTSFECHTDDSCWKKHAVDPQDREKHINFFGFDNMQMSFLTMFSITALDEWMHISDPIRRSEANTNWFGWIFCGSAVVILGLLAINLFLASITFSYLELRQKQRQQEALDAAHRTIVSVLMNPTQAHSIIAVQNSKMIASIDNAFDPNEDVGALRQFCRAVTDETRKGVKFDDFILVIVCINIFGMATESYDQEDWHKILLAWLEGFFTIIYCFEAFVKIGANGFAEYIGKNMNRMDFFIVLTALFGYAVELYVLTGEAGVAEVDATGSGSSLKIVRLLRVVRAMRAVRLGKVIFRAESIRRTMSQAFASLDAVFSLIGMLLFILVVMSLLGVHLFWDCHKHCIEEGIEESECVDTRGNYATLGNSFLANYQLFTRDNWASIMFEYMECTGTFASSIYFVSMFSLLNFVLLPIFVSIFLDNFSLSDEAKRSKQVELYVKSTFQHSKGIINVLDVKYINLAVRLLYRSSKVLKRVPVKMIGSDPDEDPFLDPLSSRKDDTFIKLERQSSSTAVKRSISRTESDSGQIEDLALCCNIPVSSPFRSLCKSLVDNIIFVHFITVMILLSGISMAAEGPEGTVHDDDTDRLFEVAETTFYLVFLVECVLKIIANGFYGTPNAYLTNVTNSFDFIVVLVTTVDRILRLANVTKPWVQMVRLMRTLRLVRLLTFFEGMGVMAQAIVKCFPSVGAIIVLLLGNILVFSIIGMNLFMGEMHYCNEGKTMKYAESLLNRTGCMLYDETHEIDDPSWTSSEFNFDSFGDALATLTITSTRQGWYIIFYKVADSAEYLNAAPSHEQNIVTASTFFCIFILINGFMLEELFIGMLVEVFSQSSGTVLLTAAQKKLRYIKVFLFHKRMTARPAPSHSIGVACYDLVTSAVYKMAINVLVGTAILVVVISEAVYKIKDAPDGVDVYDVLNMLILVLYTSHTIVRFIAYFNWDYVKQSWADIFVLVILWIASVLGFFQHAGAIDERKFGWVQMLQCLRVTWLVEILNSWPPMRKLVHTIRLSVPQTLNIATLFFLVLFVFGIVAMKLYGDIDVGPERGMSALGELANFGDIISAMTLLAQISTGQPLPYLVSDMRHDPVDINGKVVGTNSLIPFLFIFFIISNFVFLNLFVALLLENFEYIWEGEIAIEEVEIESFDDGWTNAVEDPDQQTLNARKLWYFVDTLEGTLSNVIHSDPFWYNRLLVELDIEADDVVRGDTYIGKEELLLALTRMRYGNSCLPFELQVEAELKLKRLHEQNAMRLIRVYVRAWRMMRHPPEKYKTAAEISRHKSAVKLARLWAIGVVIRNSRLTRHQSWHAQDVENTIRNHGRFAQLTRKIVEFDNETPDSAGLYPTADIKFPPELNEAERKHCHTISEELGLQHGSVGNGENRHIRVWRTGAHHSGVSRE